LSILVHSISESYSGSNPSTIQLPNSGLQLEFKVTSILLTLVSTLSGVNFISTVELYDDGPLPYICLGNNSSIVMSPFLTVI